MPHDSTSLKKLVNRDIIPKIYLSEMTFAPGGGCIRYPEWFDREMGKKFSLPIDNQINTGGGVLLGDGFTLNAA